MPEYYAIVKITYSRQYEVKVDDSPDAGYNAVQKAIELAKKDAPQDAEIEVMDIDKRN